MSAALELVQGYEDWSLDQLQEGVREEHCASLGAAIRAGEMLLEARKRVPKGGWKEWCEGAGVAPMTAHSYMRVAVHRDTVAGEPSINAAVRVLRERGLGLAEHCLVGGPVGAEEWRKGEALALEEEGLTQAEVAEVLGVSKHTLWAWKNPELAREKRDRRARSAKARRHAVAALAKQRQQEERAAAAKKTGGGIAQAYSLTRRLLQQLDYAIGQHEGGGRREVAAELRVALTEAHRVEDALGRALRVP